MVYYERIPTTEDLAKLRGSKHTYDFTWNAAPKVVIATAQINQTLFTYPLAELTVDHKVGWSDIREGMAVWIGTEPETYDVTAGVVRKAPVGNTLYIDAKSLGDGGYARNIYRGLANNYYVTILKHRPLWGFLSSIRGGIFYKKWDKAYTDEGSNPNALISLGKHQRARADETGYALVEWEAFIQNWGVKTTTSQVWYGDIGEIVVGDIFSDRIVSRYSPGFYVIEFAANDSGGKLSTAYRYLWVNPQYDTGDGASFGSTHKWQIEDDKQDTVGREINLTVFGDLTTEEIYPGQPFLFTEEAYYGGLKLDNPDVGVNNFIGYSSEYRPFRAARASRVSLNLKSPIGCSKAIPAATQLIQEAVAPANWTEGTSALTQPVGAIYYVLEHHCPSILHSQDFEFTNDIGFNREQAIKMAQDNIGSQIISFSETMPGVVGCRSDGTLVCLRSPMHMDNDDRNSMSTKFSWNAGDLEGKSTGLRYLKSLPLKAGQVKCFALAYEGGEEALPYASLAPGKAQAQGSGKPQYTFILPYSNPSAEQARLNEMSGHQFAIENAAIPEVEFRADRNLDICEPVDINTWHELVLSDDVDPLGIGFDTRCIPTRVRRKYTRNRNQWIKTIDVTMQLETFGQPGVTIPVERGEWEDWVLDGFNLQIGVEFDPIDDEIDDEYEGDPALPNEYLINFNRSGWQNWDDQGFSGSVGDSITTQTGGNPGKCRAAKRDVDAGFIGEPFFSKVGITVGLDRARTITEIEFDYSTFWDDYTPSSTDWNIFTSTGYSVGGTVSNINGGWRARLETGLNDIGATSVTVQIQLTGNSAVVGLSKSYCFVDNIRVKCLPL